jgi:hypothetical protein
MDEKMMLVFSVLIIFTLGLDGPPLARFTVPVTAADWQECRVQAAQHAISARVKLAKRKLTKIEVETECVLRGLEA